MSIIYLQHFGLTQLPFETNQDHEALFDSIAIQESLARLRYLVEVRGIGLLTGEVGSGKTTICRQLVKELNPGLHRVCYISLTTGSILNTLNVIGAELGLACERDRASAWRALRTEVLRLSRKKNQLPLLIIDEAHHLHNTVLEELRLVISFEMDATRHMCLLLVGLSPLRHRLCMATHESLAQRLMVRHEIGRLSDEETRDYISHRLKLAGCADTERFEENAIEALHRNSQGLPRQLNRLCHHAMMAAASEGAHRINSEHVRLATLDVQL